MIDLDDGRDVRDVTEVATVIAPFVTNVVESSYSQHVTVPDRITSITSITRHEQHL